MRVETWMYLESSKEANWALGEELGLSDKALQYFRHALLDVKCGVEVDTETGEARIITIDGRKVEP